MSEIESWLERYEGTHRDLANPLVYWAAVPMIVLGTVGVLWYLPTPFEFYTADELWTDEHTSSKMLEFHLDGAIDLPGAPQRLGPAQFGGVEGRMRARDLVERLDLDPTKKARTYSKGNRQKVALVAALASDAELLLLDEPAGGLDPAARREFLETSIQLLNEAGSTILFSSHHMTDVERMAGRVVMIHEGVKQLDDTLDDTQEPAALGLRRC